MREKLLFSVDTPYRQNLPVKGWCFGSDSEKSLAVMGAMRGNELQQMYSCAMLIQTLEQLEQENALSPECGIIVIPCANQFSMNVGRRFWAADNTDINRMFPGYDQGETTQRIAARIFAALQGYTYGVQMASFYLPGDFLPHIRMMDTGYEHAGEAVIFGLPYVIIRTPQPYDTTTLNYNWQVWDTQAFSLYTRETDCIDQHSAALAVEAVLRFLYKKGLSKKPVEAPSAEAAIFWENRLHSVLSSAGGLFLRKKSPGDLVKEDDVLAEILEPCTGCVLEQLRPGCEGRVFFAHKAQLICGHEVAFKVMP